MKILKILHKQELKIYKWMYENNMIKFIILLGIGNFIWLTRQSYIDYMWLIHHDTPLRPVDFLILCIVVPIHWLIVTIVLYNYFFKKITDVPNNFRHLFLLDVFYIAFRIYADMHTDESMGTHYLIAFVNIVLLCGFNWACFFNCIKPNKNEK